MLTKIRSNRDPRDTLYSELRKEFNTYFQVAGSAFKRFSAAYPKFLFAGMTTLMLVSGGLSFTIFRHPEKRNLRPPAKSDNSVQHGFDQITGLSTAIHETLQLRKVVDSLSVRKQLTRADSILLDSTLDRLSRLKQSLK